MSLPRWPLPALALVTFSMALLAMPARWEGPPLLPISPGHALSVLDLVALVPLAAGILSLYVGLWRRRRPLLSAVADAPGIGMAVSLAVGTGMGLLIASAFSTFFWWWAVGAALFGAAILALVLWAGGAASS